MKPFPKTLGIFLCMTTLAVTADEATVSAKADPTIAKLADQYSNEIFELRTRLYQTPELANREFHTAKMIEKFLRELKFDEVRTQVAHTGVIGIIKGGKPGPVVALRAAIDAQPEEKKPTQANSQKKSSTKEMTAAHSVGHDVNTALLLGTARVLAGMREQLPGTVELIFQPAGETALIPAGEKGGAQLMVAENALKNPRPDAIIAMHTAPMPSGIVQYRSGVQFAQQYRLTIDIAGQGTTGGMPWLGKDPVPTAAAIINALQMIPGRQLDITHSATVISIGKIQAGPQYNSIADNVTMEGTLRLTDDSIEQDILQRIRRTVEKTAESSGLTAKLNIEEMTPLVNNDAQLTERLAPLLKRNPWISRIETSPIITGSEDFSFFSQQVPGFYFLLGTGSKEQPATVNKESLTQGVKIISSLVVDYLASTNPSSSTRVLETGAR